MAKNTTPIRYELINRTAGTAEMQLSFWPGGVVRSQVKPGRTTKGHIKLAVSYEGHKICAFVKLMRSGLFATGRSAMPTPEGGKPLAILVRLTATNDASPGQPRCQLDVQVDPRGPLG